MYIFSNSHNQKSNTEFLDGTKNSPDMNNTVSLPSIDKKQANFFLNKVLLFNYLI